MTGTEAPISPAWAPPVFSRWTDRLDQTLRSSRPARHVILVLLVASSLAASSESTGAAAECTRDPFTAELVADLEEKWPNNHITAEVEDLVTGCRYSLHRDNRQTTASVVKIAIMGATLLRAQDEHRGLTEWERDQIVPMISESDNPTASRLWVSLGGSAGMQHYLDRFGLAETEPVSPKWGASVTSASDQVNLITQLVIGGGPLEENGRNLARGFLLGVVTEQRWGATAGVPDHWAVPMKNGFYPSILRAWRINTVGLVERPSGSGWALAVLTDGWSTDEAGIEAAEYVVLAVTRAMMRGNLPPFGPRVWPE